MNLQLELPFQEFSSCTPQSLDSSSTFINNMKLPVHRWFRFSAGFSAQWVETIITQAKERGETTVLDPFSGSGTTLLASEKLGVECLGIEAHPFVVRIARAKLLYQTDADTYLEHIEKVIKCAENVQPCVDTYPKLIHECFSISSLESLDRLRQSWEKLADDSSESQLVWLTLVSILRHVSHAGTAPWQYILPNKKKQYSLDAMSAFGLMAESIATDMRIAGKMAASIATLIQSDARTSRCVYSRSA
ncbi:MAG: DNA methyltransferase [Nostoc sp.]|uniref:DNA methyltransferase n=1 Tax=Nostoc sp. TaxID=1180 RepID=UPI002FFBFD35